MRFGAVVVLSNTVISTISFVLKSLELCFLTVLKVEKKNRTFHSARQVARGGK